MPTIAMEKSGVGIATINPFRYRGYYYDAEIQLYYIQSRYYDALIGRFINLDDEQTILINASGLQFSLFNYCLNSPINYIDVGGKIAITITVSVFVAASLIKLLIGMLLFGVATTVLLNSGFQRALANAISVIGTGIKSLSNDVVKAIDGALDKAKKKRRDNRHEKHHIVAQKSSNCNAVESRKLIAKVGIGVNSSHNLVDIKYNLHRCLHTNAYYKAIHMFLRRTKGSYKKTVLVLAVIKKALQAASKVCP